MERKKALYKLLVGNLDDTAYLFALELQEVVNVLQKKGYDYTEDELIEFISELRKNVKETSEIDSLSLDNITGGVQEHTGMPDELALNIRIMAVLNNCVWKHAV